LLVMRALIALALVFPALLCVAHPSCLSWCLLPLREWIRWLGFGLGVLTIAGVGWVLHALGPSISETALTKPEQQLVITGPYRWVRHPLYTAGLSLFVSISLMQGNLLLLLTTALAAAFFRMVIIPAEERALIAKFNGHYQTYKTRTGRLLPRI